MWSQPTDSSVRAISESRPLIFCRIRSYVAQTFSLCPIPPHFVKFGNATSFFRIGIMSERPPGRDPPNTIRVFGVSYHLNRRFLGLHRLKSP